MPVWVEQEVALAIHEEQLAEHGGLADLRDASGLESALSRPRHLAAYGLPDLADLAAAYGFGLSRNHPFADSNKRTSLVVTELFLMLNGFELVVDDETLVATWLALAEGVVDEAMLAAWLRANMAAVRCSST